MHDYELAVMQEIRMLLDFIAGNATMSIEKLEVPSPWDRQERLATVEILNRIAEINRKLEDQGRSQPSDISQEEASFLLIVRNALNTIVRPASALTVAYTGLVVGHRMHGDEAQIRKSRWSLARAAFPQLVAGASWHRRGHYLILALALLVTLFAVWESAKVALGKALLQNLQDLRAQQAVISAEKAKLESDRDRPDRWAHPEFVADDGREYALRLCDRPSHWMEMEKAAKLAAAAGEGKADPQVFDSPAQRDVCDRDRILALQFAIAKSDLRQYQTYWPAMIGSLFQFLGDVASLLPHSSDRMLVPGGPEPGEDVEFAIAPALAVHANYVLPAIFAFLGAAAFVILDFYGKVRDSVLAPRDHLLSWIRLWLGLMIGGCIGLLVSSYAPSPPASAQPELIVSLTLSASGMAFLAGFGVEGVFTMLQALVRRMFSGDTPRSSVG